VTRRNAPSGASLTVSPPSSTSAKHITPEPDSATAPDKAVEKKFGNRTMPDRWAEAWARKNGRPIPDMRAGNHGGRDILVDPLPRPEDDAPRKRRITPAAVPTEQLLVVMTRGRPVKTRCALTKEQYDAHMATLELEAAERAEAAARLALVEAARRDESARLALKAATAPRSVEYDQRRAAAAEGA